MKLVFFCFFLFSVICVVLFSKSIYIKYICIVNISCLIKYKGKNNIGKIITDRNFYRGHHGRENNTQIGNKFCIDKMRKVIISKDTMCFI